MTQNEFLTQLRRYANVALRKRKSYADVALQLAQMRYDSATEDVSDPVLAESDCSTIASQTVANYSKFDPFFSPTFDEVMKELCG